MSINAPGANKQEREELEAILGSGKDREILATLREQTALVVVMVRVANEDRKRAKLSQLEEENA